MNPFFCYALSFSVAMLLYSLGWSDLYPALSLPLAIFLAITIAAHATAGYWWRRKFDANGRSVLDPDLNSLRVTFFIYLLWLVDFLYEGGAPLLKIILNVPYDYKKFGVPTLHVFTVTFASFYTVYLFHLFLSTRRRLTFILYSVNLFAAILIYSRAMLFFNLAASMCLLVFHLNHILVRHVALSLVALLLALYLFGVLGNIREAHVHRLADGNEKFLETGGASASFRESFVPNEFFWTYIYVTSPIANLQLNINKADRHPVMLSRTFEMIVSELSFDAITKRIFKAHWMKDPGEHTIFPFNVSTVYSRSFSYQGWFGMSLLACVLLVLPWLYIRLPGQHSPYFLTGVAILCTVYLFMMYDNTIRITGLGFQLVYPVLFGWLGRKGIFKLARKPS